MFIKFLNKDQHPYCTTVKIQSPLAIVSNLDVTLEKLSTMLLLDR